MPETLAHAVAEGNKGFIQESSGVMLLPFIYMGAKHMMTGYDHLLFLFGVIFFLYRMKDVGLYITLFAAGHSITLLLGVFTEISISSYVIDAIIGFSVVYKALDNLGAFQRWFGFQPNTKVATLVFGLLHGFGLATKIQEYEISADGLTPNQVHLTRRRSNDRPILEIWIHGVHTYSVWEKYKRVINQTKRCFCGASGLRRPKRLRRCIDHTRQASELALAMRDWEDEEKRFWDSMQGLTCCGTCDSCPLLRAR
ncbi:HupE/UreJ family protein [Pseudomonas wadenswilerensis]|uniref:Plasmid pTOM9 ORF1-like protein n=2 Tax=Pseudomonas wadenswilerensis TaxID=1785161 RepID=A0A380SYY3_9PSED|nr:Plasmid pTOM9 ORF1-like protein [Pseudomonas wadenswilerensis]